MLKFQSVSFSYDKKEVLHELSFHLAKGEILAVMGESGCGKSTLLNLASGLLKPTGGCVERHAEQIAYAFQEPRLFPWLTVYQNLAAVLSNATGDARSKIDNALETVALAEAKDLYPDELSGGMKSRVSLARALAFGGDLYLLDEPFAALDEELRARLSESIRKRIKESGASAIIVTHQTADAERMADRIITL